MSSDVLLILAALVVGFALVAWYFNKRLAQISEKQKPSDEIVEWLKSTNQKIDEQNKTFVQTLQQNSTTLNERLDNAARVIHGVQQSVGEMNEIGRNMRELQEFLRSPKLRGNIGEQVLKELLSQYLPKQSFHLQYTFKSGDKVDALIKTTAGNICIDSKFPMENFKKMVASQTEQEKKEHEKQFVRDVKSHIDAISKKYILTEEGTVDYALMYIPSEAVYYEIANNTTLLEYAGDKRILPVSPSLFYAYLKAILMSFEGQKIEAQAKEILNAIRAIQKDYEKVEGNLSLLGKHLNNAYNSMANVFSSFGLLGQKISSTKSLGETPHSEVENLEVPQRIELS
ncbi:MAG: hypothetical protein A3D24_02645 [Candidatus Blackburnbacteria bacterium RIFCSPHIGHO2_02_FULL_39_13]|uniref:DNA recombination protein RmuC n=1 Tax=Candidatus Blackburnbacteria bacterium RIFCSPLOWO2_01_FULL_40_20 TaxID=1797519 RepID=A0A1G1VFA9_9BACT|nr:MAG: hypothetical protein UT38_C0008G0002 [Microgenomates group bacterium GW2011_GWA2_39_19]OGY07251.1 MAG: hypothetical protein A2694_00080 [Candidatus Blackburnbacteria bacterium RIFCSPHIGHO2_01_FULL_40_17]OGY09277.1 MAG: hypothetical protein A3D24_02645 [Candidatus Blackburnbacteria bacterium RIFCSPHIGHO2_02_FULL_39_13]OGY13902.1 MAG: hypothetical protein A3A77_01235 [Candidatus Blackburnbacteria bacterium RIFCSPLOWO2_01_FULL_40_20]OGY14930.1 MAG: hypothetical protein A3I52_02655 [Candida